MKPHARSPKPGTRVAVRRPYPWELDAHASNVSPTPRCPLCRFSGFVRASGRLGRCGRCGMEFEGDPEI